jgi:hypothetical protein
VHVRRDLLIGEGLGGAITSETLFTRVRPVVTSM